MNIDDKKLDDLLGDIRVPNDLKERLRQIPHEQFDEPVSAKPSVVISESPKVRLQVKWMAGLAIAAGLTGLALFVWWPTSNESSNHVARTLHRIDERALQIEQLLDQIELDKLSASLTARRIRMPPAALTNVQSESFVISLADQAAIHFGASVESVRDDMKRVIERYPNTSGSTIAQQFLNKH